ncbi:CDP-glycerol glycerophosphotransferase family protein [Peribacillus simplex]|uniref:CDP-glycerol glycerophosphotransferase family protein n=1 Tax=Peribacillus simplex TaxID=1478 RepID=UPI0037C799E1
MNFKKRSTYYNNTWQGKPFKKIGADSISTSIKTGLGSKKIYTQNLIISQSYFDTEIFSRLFKVDTKNIILCDFPRNDCLTRLRQINYSTN